jgi:hypothetical protein
MLLSKKIPDVPMSSFAYCKFHMCVVCGLKRVGSMIARGRVGASFMQMGHSTYSMGMEWKGIRTYAFKATTSVTDRRMRAQQASSTR